MKVLALLICLAFLPVVYGEVLIIGINIPGLHQKDGNGEYDKLIDKILVNKGKATLKILPPARAEATFAKCSNCCFSPANKNPEFYDFGAEYTQTKPMGIAKIHIWTGKGTKPLHSLNDLIGKKVGIRHGMPYGKTFSSLGLKTDPVSTIKTNIKKLDAKRIDAFVAYVPDAYRVFEKLGIEPYPHAKDKPVAVHEDSLVCRGVSAQFISDFNNGL